MNLKSLSLAIIHHHLQGWHSHKLNNNHHQQQQQRQQHHNNNKPPHHHNNNSSSKQILEMIFYLEHCFNRLEHPLGVMQDYSNVWFELVAERKVFCLFFFSPPKPLPLFVFHVWRRGKCQQCSSNLTLFQSVG